MVLLLRSQSLNSVPVIQVGWYSGFGGSQPATDKERGDLEIKDYVVLQKPQDQSDRLPPPRILILDFILTHTRFGRSHVYSTGHQTHTRRSNGTPESHYHQLYINHPDPISFMSGTVDTSGRIYDDFSRLLFLHTNRESSVLSNEIPEESGQFRLIRVVC